MRTTSGSWRVARDFPNLPAWIVKAVGGSTTHWSGATPRFMEHEFRTRTVLRRDRRREPARLADHPRRAGALVRQGGEGDRLTHRHGRPPLPANNNYKVFANGAERVGYQLLRDRPVRDERRAVRRPAGLDPGRLQLPGRQARRPSGRPLVREIPRALDDRQARPAAGVPGREDHPRRQRHGSTRVMYLDADGQPAPAGREGGLRGRQLDRVAAAAADERERAAPGRPGELLGPGRPQLHAAHDRLGRTRSSSKPVRMYRGETMAGIIADEARHDTSRGFAGGYYMETLSLGPAFLAAFVEPGSGARLHREDGRLRATPPACGSSARTCRRRRTGSR